MSLMHRLWAGLDALLQYHSKVFFFFFLTELNNLLYRSFSPVQDKAKISHNIFSVLFNYTICSVFLCLM